MSSRVNAVLDEVGIPCLTPNFSVVRVLNALSSAVTIDVLINNLVVADDLPNEKFGGYMTIPKGRNTVKVYVAQQKKVPTLALIGAEIPESQVVTIAVVGTLPNIQLVRIIDDVNEDISPDEIKARIINLSTDSLNFNASSNGNTISRLLSPNQVTEYMMVTPGEYRITAAPSGSGGGPIPATIISLTQGRIYTIYILSNVDSINQPFIPGRQYEIISSVDGNTIFKKCT
ncbi:MAG TPA: DUF4397 domain-containing protein [Peptostreptococcaceae bacterium]|nr:DUF4397 domain-containing protein [Peptostreptococcaceae bacterium]